MIKLFSLNKWKVERRRGSPSSINLFDTCHSKVVDRVGSERETAISGQILTMSATNIFGLLTLILDFK